MLQHGGRGGNLSVDNPCRVACSCRFSRMQPARPLSPSNLSTGTHFSLQTGTCHWSLGAAPHPQWKACAHLVRARVRRPPPPASRQAYVPLRGPRNGHAHSSLSWLTGGTESRSRGDREASFSKSSAEAAAGPLEEGARGSW